MSKTIIEEIFIAIQQGHLFVKTWKPGKDSAQSPILLLHDSLGCVDMWRDFPERLCEQTQRPVIAYDRWGFGKSSTRTDLPSRWFICEEAEIYLPQLLKALDVQSCTLFGHSVGGAMAIAAAARLSSQVDYVVSESAQAFVEDRTRAGIQKAQVDFKNSELFSKLQKYHGDKTQWVLDAWIQVWLSRDFAGWSLDQDLPRMKCPVLVIHGDHDEYGSLQFPERIASQAGGKVQKEIMMSCGHVPHREKIEQVLQLVAHFLKQN